MKPAKPKRALVQIDPEVHYQLKLVAMEQGKSLEAITSEALDDWMKRNPQRKIIVVAS